MSSNLINLFLLSVVEIYGDFSLQKYVVNDSKNSLLFGIVGYIAVVYFLIQSLKEAPILYVNGMWDGFSAILESFSAYMFLGQRFKHNIQYVGLIMIIIGLFFLKDGYGRNLF